MTSLSSERLSKIKYFNRSRYCRGYKNIPTTHANINADRYNLKLSGLREEVALEMTRRHAFNHMMSFRFFTSAYHESVDESR